MLSPAGFHELVSGRRRGLPAGVLRSALAVAEIPYSLAVRARNAAYDRGLLAIERAPIPVVSVGNLSLGGTGKTPLVAWIAAWFGARGVRVGVASRGYKARPGAGNDEALELAQKLPAVPHVQNRDRLAAVRELAALGCRIAALDDAFQHRRIARDLDLVLLDALEPFGWEHVVPRGTLREPPAGLARAQAIALSRADAVPADERAAIRARVSHLAPGAQWLELVHRPRDLLAADGQRHPLEHLTGLRLAAFCGIGNPAGFQHTLNSLSGELAGFRSFPDHHRYGPAELADLAAWTDGLGSIDAILCTQKDLVKLPTLEIARRPLWAVAIELEIAAGRQQLERRLQDLLPD